MRRIAFLVAAAIGLSGCSKAQQTEPKYWEKLLSNPKKVDAAMDEIGDKLQDPKHREWGSDLVVKYWDRSPEKAAKALGKLRHPNAAGIDKLTEALRSNDPGLMKNAAEALRHLGGTKAVPELIRVLTSWTPKNLRDLTGVRTEAVKALGAFKAREAVPALAKMAADRTHGKIVNLRAVEALGEIGDPSAIPALIQALYLACPEDKCSAAARIALNRIGSPAVRPLLKVTNRQDPEIEKLAKELKLKDSSVTGVALLVLGDIGGGPVARDLAGRWLGEQDSFSKVNAIRAIGYAGGEDLVGPLLAAYKKSMLEARTNILHALGRIGSPRAIPFLAQVIKKREDPNLLWTAGQVLSLLGGEDELPIAEAALQRAKRELPAMRGEDAAVTRQTIKFFQTFVARLRAAKGCSDEACWRGKLASPEKEVRVKAARMLAFAKDRAAAEKALLGALADPDADVREEISFALSRVGTPAAAAALEKRIAEDKEKAGMKGALFQYQLLAARLRGRA